MKGYKQYSLFDELEEQEEFLNQSEELIEAVSEDSNSNELELQKRKNFKAYMSGLASVIAEENKGNISLISEIKRTLYESENEFYSFNKCPELIDFLIDCEVKEKFEKIELLTAVMDLAFKDIQKDFNSITGIENLYNRHIEEFQNALKENEKLINELMDTMDNLFASLNVYEFEEKEMILEQIEEGLSCYNELSVLEKYKSEEVFQKRFSSWNEEIKNQYKPTLKESIEYYQKKADNIFDNLYIGKAERIDIINSLIQASQRMELFTGNKYFDRNSNELKLVFIDIDYLEGLEYFKNAFFGTSIQDKIIQGIFNKGIEIIQKHFKIETNLISLYSGQVEKQFRNVMPDIEAVSDDDTDIQYIKFRNLTSKLYNLLAEAQSLKGEERLRNLEEQEEVKKQMSELPFVVSNEGLIFKSKNQFEIHDCGDKYMTINPATNERTITYKRHLHTVKDYPNEIYALIVLLQQMQAGKDYKEIIQQSEILKGLQLNTRNEKDYFLRNNKIENLMQFLYDYKSLTPEGREIPFIFSPTYAEARILSNTKETELLTNCINPKKIEVSIPAERKEILKNSTPFGFDEIILNINVVSGRQNEKTLHMNARKIGMYIDQNHSGKGKFIYKASNLMNQLINHRPKEEYIRIGSRDFQRERNKLEEALNYLKEINYIHSYCYWNNRKPTEQPKGKHIFEASIFVLLEKDFLKYKEEDFEKIYRMNSEEQTTINQEKKTKMRKPVRQNA